MTFHDTIESARAALRRLGVALWAVDFERDGYPDQMSEDETSTRVQVGPDGFGANAYGSRMDNGSHLVMLDIDIPVHVIPSSTPGHCHLVFEKRVSWDSYVQLLGLLSELGIIEHGYASLMMERGQAFLRLPGVKKQKVSYDPEVLF